MSFNWRLLLGARGGPGLRRLARGLPPARCSTTRRASGRCSSATARATARPARWLRRYGSALSLPGAVRAQRAPERRVGRLARLLGHQPPSHPARSTPPPTRRRARPRRRAPGAAGGRGPATSARAATWATGSKRRTPTSTGLRRVVRAQLARTRLQPGQGLGQARELLPLHAGPLADGQAEAPGHGAIIAGPPARPPASARPAACWSPRRRGIARPRWKPWASGAPPATRKRSCSSVSTPSATAVMPSAPASARIAVTIAVASRSARARRAGRSGRS